jgi:hypothetical protein
VFCIKMLLFTDLLFYEILHHYLEKHRPEH